VKCGGALIALAIISACAGSPADAPSNPALNGANIGRMVSMDGRPVTAARLSNPIPRYESILPYLRTIRPDRHRKTTKYEYVINSYGSYASIFDYPKSVQQIGMINNVGGQGCTNVLDGYGNKIIWIVAGQDQITEYKVPQTPLKTLSVAYSFPTSCAMDTSGDLAVGVYGTDGGGDVLIFKNATGSPTVYTTALDEEFFDGYDPQGDLFADGFTGYRTGFALVELPKGGTKFVKIKTSNTVQFPGSVQWDGTYLTVFDQLANATYRYTVSGTMATLKSTVQLTGAGDCAQTWIVPGLLYCGDAFNDEGEAFKYPQGGAPIATFTGSFDIPYGVVAAKN
jgi:hypothetical protein